MLGRSIPLRDLCPTLKAVVIPRNHHKRGVRPDGEIVTATFLAEETAGGCVFAGTAIG